MEPRMYIRGFFWGFVRDYETYGHKKTPQAWVGPAGQGGGETLRISGTSPMRSRFSSSKDFYASFNTSCTFFVTAGHLTPACLLTVTKSPNRSTLVTP